MFVGVLRGERPHVCGRVPGPDVEALIEVYCFINRDRGVSACRLSGSSEA